MNAGLAVACALSSSVAVLLWWLLRKPRRKVASVKPLEVVKGKCVDGEEHTEYVICTPVGFFVVICSVCSAPMCPPWLACTDCRKVISPLGFGVSYCSSHKPAENEAA